MANIMGKVVVGVIFVTFLLTVATFVDMQMLKGSFKTTVPAGVDKNVIATEEDTVKEGTEAGELPEALGPTGPTKARPRATEVEK